MVDLTFLRTFTRGNQEKVVRYINMYLETAPGILAKMKTALDAKDWEGLATQAHAFKAQADFMGVANLKEVLFKIEQKGKAGDGENMTSLVEKAFSLQAQAEPILRQETV